MFLFNPVVRHIVSIFKDIYIYFVVANLPPLVSQDGSKSSDSVTGHLSPNPGML